MDEFDIIVVGGGSAGSAVAGRWQGAFPKVAGLKYA
jgi:flavin-dependent dehydrogenase